MALDPRSTSGLLSIFLDTFHPIGFVNVRFFSGKTDLRGTVCSEMIIPNSAFTDDADFRRSAFIFRCIAWSRYTVVFRFWASTDNIFKAFYFFCTYQ